MLEIDRFRQLNQPENYMVSLQGGNIDDEVYEMRAKHI